MVGKYRAFIILGVAVVIALFTSILVYNWMHREVKNVQTLDTQPVAVAAVDIPIGTAVDKSHIKMVPFLKSSVTSSYFTDNAAVVGRAVISAMKADEPIIESRLAPASITTGGIAAAITSKKRAMAVKVDKVVGVSGFIQPGNRVDVLVTMSPKGDTGQAFTKTVLQNVLVLAVGTEVDERDKKEKPMPIDVITLELTPAEGEKLSLSATEGKIVLSLRNPSDTEQVVTRGVSVPSVMYGQGGEGNVVNTKSVKTAKSPAVIERPRPITIQVIKGSDITNPTVGGSN